MDMFMNKPIRNWLKGLFRAGLVKEKFWADQYQNFRVSYEWKVFFTWLKLIYSHASYRHDIKRFVIKYLFLYLNLT